MKTTSQTNVILVGLMMLAGIGGCSDSSTDPAKQEPKVERPGFTASVSGAVNAEVSETGIVTYLPPKEQGVMTGIRPGYYLLANNPLIDVLDGRKIMITFRIPDGTQPGNYNLTAPDPQKVGEEFDVEVEAVKEGEPIIYQTNTAGTISLDKFTPDPTYPDSSNIKGTFQFVTENRDGEQVSVNGAFDFPSKNQIVSQDTV